MQIAGILLFYLEGSPGKGVEVSSALEFHPIPCLYRMVDGFVAQNIVDNFHFRRLFTKVYGLWVPRNGRLSDNALQINVSAEEAPQVNVAVMVNAGCISYPIENSWFKFDAITS